MPAPHSCRVCETEYPLDPSGSAPASGRSSRSTTGTSSRRTVSRERSRPGRARSGATRRCCRSRRLPSSGSRRAGRRSSRAPRLAQALGVGELWLKLDTANPTHSFKDRVVAVAAAKALELGCDDARVLVDRQSRERRRRTRRGRRLEAVVLCPADLEPEKLLATAVYGARDLRRRGQLRRLQPALVELSFELDWAFVNVELRAYYAEGSKTLAFEIAEQLGWELPDAVVAPIASGSMFTKLWQGFGELLEPRARRGRRCRAFRRPGGGLLARRARRSPTASGEAGAAEDDRALARDRQPRPTATSPSRPRALGRRDPRRRPRTRSRTNIALLAETTGVFGETAPGVTLGALREAVARGELGETTASSFSSPATGSRRRTPSPNGRVARSRRTSTSCWRSSR